MIRTGHVRIGIDGSAFSSPAAGVRRYVSNLCAALLALGDSLEIVALGGDPAICPSGVQRVDAPAHPPTNLGWTLVGLPRAASRARVDVIHAPAYTAPFWAGVPVVLTIHDVSYERHPEWYPYRRDPLRRSFYRRSAKAAAHILTDSEFSAREISAAYAIAPERVTVAPLGVSPKFSPLATDVPTELPTEVQVPFLLHVGDLHERRNLPVVIEALAAARRHFGRASALTLVLAGVDRGVGDDLCRLAAESDAGDAVMRLGPVSEDLLVALYQSALALVYPSRYEGFGLPLLEAMATGTPVLAASAASLPEVAGEAALLLHPDDVGAWTEAIVQVVNDEELRARLRSAGIARAATFTWRRTAEVTLQAYRRVISA